MQLKDKIAQAKARAHQEPFSLVVVRPSISKEPPPYRVPERPSPVPASVRSIAPECYR